MSKPKMYMGIDIGIDGGIARIDGDSAAAMPMPVLGTKSQGKRSYDIPTIAAFIKIVAQENNIYAVIEDVTIDPRWHKNVTGQQYGCLYIFMTLFAVYRIPYQIKKASIWQKRIFEGMAKQDTKIMGISYCLRRFPDTDLTASERSKKPHIGITDALCIAEYCRLIMGA